MRMCVANPCWSAGTPSGVTLLETLRYFGAFSPSSTAIIRTYDTPSLPFQGVLDNFNRIGRIIYTSLVEFTVNSLVHRSLNLKAPVRILVYTEARDGNLAIHSVGIANGEAIFARLV